MPIRFEDSDPLSTCLFLVVISVQKSVKKLYNYMHLYKCLFINLTNFKRKINDVDANKFAKGKKFMNAKQLLF